MNKMLVRQAVRELRSATTERLRLSPGVDLTRPTSIRGVVNERCNYRCRYCNFWRKPDYPQEISIADWKQALASLKDLAGRYTIQFSGGEPFLKQGFLELPEFCAENDIGWGVITNGSALNARNVQRVVSASPLNIDISVDSLVASENDHLRGVDGALARVETGIKSLVAERRAQKKHFLIRLKTVVTSANLYSLPSMVDWVTEIGADTIDFSPVRPWTDETRGELQMSSKSEMRDLERIVSTLIQRKSTGAPVETSEAKLRSIPDHFRGSKTFSGLSPCRVGMRDYHIRSNGDVEVCWFFPSIGNVKHNTAREIWFSDRARKVRGETIDCTRFGTTQCANSCLTHLTLGQQMERGLLWLRTGQAS